MLMRIVPAIYSKAVCNLKSVLTYFLIFLSVLLCSCQDIEEYPYYLTRNKLNLIMVLDRSGSMSGTPNEVMKDAAKLIVDKLSENDIIAIVLFGAGASVLLEPVKAVDKDYIKNLIDTIPASDGSTDIYAGMDMGYDEASKNSTTERVSRLLLLSDGQPGDSGHEQRATEGLAEGVSISTVALGSSANLDLMESIARKGEGTFYWISDPDNLADAFRAEVDDLIFPYNR